MPQSDRRSHVSRRPDVALPPGAVRDDADGGPGRAAEPGAGASPPAGPQAWRDPAREEAYQDARRRVRKLAAFYRHLMAYLVVNTTLIVVYLITQPPKPFFLPTLLGWGVGLAIHGCIVWSRYGLLGRRWEERKIAEWMAGEQVQTLSTEKQLVEAQLRLLQAQIEPHFLFNTLANVVSLIEPAPAQATRMLEHFIAYLRASLAASRATEGTVGQEAALLGDYLEVLKVRMGRRLTYVIDVDPALDGSPLPPMLLQPVVENAIKHGLEPKIEGGQVSVRIRRAPALAGDPEGPRMIVTIEDDGMGFAPDAGTERRPGSGVGLSNLRERLAVLYDGRARLQIEERAPGTAVRIELPLAAQAVTLQTTRPTTPPARPTAA